MKREKKKLWWKNFFTIFYFFYFNENLQALKKAASEREMRKYDKFVKNFIDDQTYNCLPCTTACRIKFSCQFFFARRPLAAETCFSIKKYFASSRDKNDELKMKLYSRVRVVFSRTANLLQARQATKQKNNNKTRKKKLSWKWKGKRTFDKRFWCTTHIICNLHNG